MGKLDLKGKYEYEGGRRKWIEREPRVQHYKYSSKNKMTEGK